MGKATKTDDGSRVGLYSVYFEETGWPDETDEYINNFMDIIRGVYGTPTSIYEKPASYAESGNYILYEWIVGCKTIDLGVNVHSFWNSQKMFAEISDVSRLHQIENAKKQISQSSSDLF